LTAAVTVSALEALSLPRHYCPILMGFLQAEKIMMAIVMHISPSAPGRESGICKGNTIKIHHWTPLCSYTWRGVAR